MSFLAGETITAARLNRLQPTTYSATGSSNLTLSTTTTDITGASITLTSEAANAIYVVTATFAFDVVTATTDYAEGKFYLDSVVQSGFARWSGEVTTDYGTTAQQWRGTLSAAGSHTLKLSASRGSTGGQIDVLAAFTKIVATIYEVA